MSNITTYKLIGEKSGTPEIIDVTPKKAPSHTQALTPSDHEMFNRMLNAKGIYKVPNNIYQMMYDMAPRSNSQYEIELAQERTQKFLLSWIEDNFPNQQLDNFVDFSKKEAEALHPSLTWGMYVKVSPKHKEVECTWAEKLDIENILKLMK